MSHHERSRDRMRPMRSLSATVALLVVIACAAPASSSAPGTVSPSGSAGPSTAPNGIVRLALDWTPNTNHTGFFVAKANGWYDDAGVDLQVLPVCDARRRKR